MTKVMGGPAQPVKVVTSGKRVSGPARRVYGYAAAPTDGRKALGGPAQLVVVLTDADLKENGGSYILDGQTYAMPVFTAPAGAKVVGGPAIPVYPVNAWPAAAVVAREVLSSEIGNVNATTVVVTFDQSIDATGNDYASGWTVNVNGSPATIVSATRQVNTEVLYIILSAAVSQGQTVTITYSATTGKITGLATFAAQSVTNNVFGPATLGAKLKKWWKADNAHYQDAARTTLAAAGDDPIGSFTEYGGTHATSATDARPLLKLARQNGLPGIYFDGSNDNLKTASFALAQPFEVFWVGTSRSATDTHGLFSALNSVEVFLLNNGYIFAGAYLTGAIPTQNAAVLDRLLLNGANSEIQINEDVITTGNAGANGITAGVQFNTRWNNDTGWSEQDIYEVVLTSSLTATERSNLVSYLSRWLSESILGPLASPSGNLAVVYTGGSITVGTGASPVGNGYASVTAQFLNRRFPSATFTHTNDGHASQGSSYHVTNFDADILAHNPNLVILDLAANDNVAAAQGTGETLIRTIRTQLPNANIAMVFFPTVDDPGVDDPTNLNDAVKQVYVALCSYYGIPYADFAAEVARAVTAGEHHLNEYYSGSDGTHPINFGHHTAMRLLQTTLTASVVGGGTMAVMPTDRLYPL